MRVEAIENSGDGKIEAPSIQSEEHSPNLKRYSSATDNVSIPLIELQRGSPQELEKASRYWGFFHFINHGLPSYLLRLLESTAADFFSLPQLEKRKISRDAQSPSSYFDTELKQNVRDWKEVFVFVPREAIQSPMSFNPDDHVSEAIIN